MSSTEEKILRDINDCYKIMVLMRGLPGSGKSTLAKKIINQSSLGNSSHFIFSSDDFFWKGGKYCYNIGELSSAHEWNQNRVRNSVKNGLSPIIIDNTNLQIWEMHVYVALGVKNGYIIEILEPNTPWVLKPAVLANKNSHQVPLQKIKMMLDKYEYPRMLSGSQLVNILQLSITGNVAPSLRLKPPIRVSDRKETPLPKRQPQKGNGSSVVPSRKNDDAPDLIDLSDSHDLIDLTFESEEAKNQPSIDINDDWNEVWEEKKKNNEVCSAPKPRRNSNTRESKSYNKSIASAMSSDLINWEPIDVSMSNWELSDSKNVIDAEVPVDVDTSDVSTMTENINNLNGECKTLIGHNRDINASFMAMLPLKMHYKKATLDKGVTANSDDISDSLIDRNAKIQLLYDYSSMFEDIPLTYMNHILNKCDGNVNWAANILMDTNTKLDIPMITTETADDALLYPEDFDNDATAAGPSSTSIIQPIKIENKVKNKKSLEVISNLKKQIESNFDFGDELYSEHCLKLKKKIHGDYKVNEEASTSHENNKTDSSEDEEEEKSIKFNLGRDFILQLDNIYGINYTSNEEQYEPVINLPISLANQLHALWMESVLHQREQAQSIVREDEELAIQLQAAECALEDDYKRAASLQEIMDMEMAFAVYDSDVCKNPSKPPEDLAAKLTCQKLLEMFPEIEQNVLTEIYSAHDNNFERTMEVLLVSTGKITSDMATSSEQYNRLLRQQEKALLEKAKKEKENVKMCSMSSTVAKNFVEKQESCPLSEDEIKKSINEFRELAAFHLNIRNKYLNKARQFYNEGNPGVAIYYNELATLHSNKYHNANSYAASRVFQLNSMEEDDKCTLNLHELFVTEALYILDIFIDKHISRIRDKKIHHETLFIITGRGKHSPNQIPRIKPAVKKRLTNRHLPISFINSGLISTVIQLTSHLTVELNKNQPSTSNMI